MDGELFELVKEMNTPVIPKTEGTRRDYEK